jgi:hypothetical protein
MAEERLSRLSSSNVRVKTSYLIFKFIGRIARALLLVSLILLLVYSAVLVPTAVRVLYTDDFGFVLTKDPTIKMGGIPAGKTELVSLESNVRATDSIKNKMIAGFTPHKNTAIVKIVAGPAGRLHIDDKTGLASINGKVIKNTSKPVEYDELEKNHFFLTNQYYVQCLKGSCIVGSFYIMSDGDILGEIKTSDTDKPLINLLKENEES